MFVIRIIIQKSITLIVLHLINYEQKIYEKKFVSWFAFVYSGGSILIHVEATVKIINNMHQNIRK
jgi:uncharacterized protein (UPF0303 family)